MDNIGVVVVMIALVVLGAYLAFTMAEMIWVIAGWILILVASGAILKAFSDKKSLTGNGARL